MRRLLGVALVALAAVAPAAQARPAADGTPLTPHQADRLSRALYADYVKGGARLRVSLPALRGSARVLAGRIDWHAHLATAALTHPGTPGEPARTLLWSPSAVLETGVPGLRIAAAAVGHPQARYVASALAPSSAGLDSVLALLNGLAATKPENALLLQQGKSRYLGLATIDRARCETYRSGSLTIWLAPDGAIRRVAAYVNSYAKPVRIDLLAHARQTIGIPTKAAVVSITLVPTLKGNLARDLR
jgi:hypothetical protein